MDLRIAMDLYERAMQDFREAGVEPTPEELEYLEEIKSRGIGDKKGKYLARLSYLGLPSRLEKMVKDEQPREILQRVSRAVEHSSVVVIHGNQSEFMAVQISAHLCRVRSDYAAFVYARDVKREFSKNIGFGDQQFRSRLESHYLFMRVLYDDDLDFSEFDYFLRKRFDAMTPTFLIVDKKAMVPESATIQYSYVEVN